MTTLALLLFSTIPHDAGITETRCETLEICRCWDFDSYNEEYRLFCHQLIGWDKHWKHDEVCCDWKLWKPGITVQRDYVRGGYKATWFEHGKLNVVRSDLFREWDYDYDPECENRKVLAADKRRKFAR